MYELYVDGFREVAESMMQDAFAVYAPGQAGDPVPDGQLETIAYTAQGTTVGKIAGPSQSTQDSNARVVEVGGTSRTVVEGGLSIPVSAPCPTAGDFGVGWEYVLITPGPATPPDLLDSRWLVVDAPSKSYMTARRLDVVRLS